MSWHSSLLEEQNYEYEQCVFADLEKQYERHNAEILRQVIIDSWKEERAMKAAQIRPEPEKNEPNIITVAFRIKKTTESESESEKTKPKPIIRIIRRFRNQDTVQDLMNFVDCLNDVEPLEQVRVCTPMPFRILEASMESLQVLFPDIKELSLVVEVE